MLTTEPDRPPAPAGSPPAARRRAIAALALAVSWLALAGAAPAQGAEGFVESEVVVGFERGGASVVELPDGVAVKAAVEALEGDPAVEFAAPNWIARPALAPLDEGSEGVPGGWELDQWSFLGRPGGVRAGRTWDRAIAAGREGGAGTTVAVVDTGVAYTDTKTGHEIAPDFVPGQFVDGIDLVADDEQPLDENGHGTHVAGTIAEQVTLGTPAAGDDYLTGLAYGASVMPIRVLDADGLGSAGNVGDGILWAARNGADVINVSLQFDRSVDRCADVPTVCKATRKARELGSLVVAAAGNAAKGKGKPRALYPAAAPGVLGVGATTEHGCLASYSHYGDGVDLLAPGGGGARGAAAHRACDGDRRPILQLTLGCFPGPCEGEYGRFAIRADVGTSMATAHVSGIAALVRASRVSGGDPSPARLGRRLKCTARSQTPRRFYGNGLLDGARATDPGRRC